LWLIYGACWAEGWRVKYWMQAVTLSAHRRQVEPAASTPPGSPAADTWEVMPLADA
jgi:hypothetical protein